MPHPHDSATTYTVEMNQIVELNSRLATHSYRGPITAQELGLEGAPLLGRTKGQLPASAVIVRLSWQGPPEFPFIHGHFANDAAGSEAYKIDLHTPVLRELSHRLGARQIWGVGSVPDDTTGSRSPAG